MLAASVLVLVLPLPAEAASLKLRSKAPAEPAPAPGPAGAPGPGPAPAPAPIRPGIVVRVTDSKQALLKSFEGQGIRYSPLMDSMLGKDFVVKNMDHGGAGLPSPDGTQEDVWYFPLPALTPWSETKDARIPPVAGRAFKAVGLPTHARLEVGPPSRHEAPWEYSVRGRNLLDPIAPPMNERVDLEATAMALPPYMKVKQVVDVECLEKLHKDPNHLCNPEAYVDYNKVTPAPTTEKPLTQAEAKALKKQIKHLKKQIHSLTPKEMEVLPELKDFEVSGWKSVSQTMNSAGAYSERHLKELSGGHKMEIGKEASKERFHTAQGHSEKEDEKKENEEKQEKEDSKKAEEKNKEDGKTKEADTKEAKEKKSDKKDGEIKEVKHTKKKGENKSEEAS